MTRLHDLYLHGGQSPWIDDLKRSYVTAGGLEHLAQQGVRGVTSNPTIMAKSIAEGADYDAHFASLLAEGSTVEEAYWELVLFDVVGAARVLWSVYESSAGTDGFVSVEVSPHLARDTAATLEAARALHVRVDSPNVLIKIPATVQGLPAIESMIAEGRSVNVTLIFSLERYDAVIEAYLRGLERLVAAGGHPSAVASVASFFVSRLDTEVDRRLEALGGEEAAALRGTAALAQARRAYALFEERFNSERFAVIAEHGARVQRPLWASTSTKNAAYPDLLYVNGLIGPNTVDTMPAATLAAFLDHGTVTRTIDADPAGARTTLERLAAVGVDLAAVTAQLEEEGLDSFAKSYDEVLTTLGDKAASTPRVVFTRPSAGLPDLPPRP